MAAMYTLGLAVAIATLCIAWVLTSTKSSKKLPPGPKAKPVIGNLHDLPPAGSYEWEHWAKFNALYGPISSVTVMGQTIVIINSLDIANELLDKRGASYSDRPSLYFAMEMCGGKNNVGTQQNGPILRAMRQGFHNFMGTSGSTSRFENFQDADVAHFLADVLKPTGNLYGHLRQAAGSTILKMTYGYSVRRDGSDRMIQMADQAIEEFGAAAVPGKWLVDMMPALRFIPEWMPGGGFKKIARGYAKTIDDAATWPLLFVEKAIKEGKGEPSYVKDRYDKQGDDRTAEDQYVTKWSATSMYAAGVDTSISTEYVFFAAMRMHPEVQAKAQEEIDRVLGPYSLPRAKDRPRLPYVEAVVKEVLRWHPAVPLGIAHLSGADDEYNGYTIPKNAMIVPNIWFFAHDPENYKNPSTFNPDRFIGPSPELDPYRYVFGFGRRICPGKRFADTSVWLLVAQSLATLKIRTPPSSSPPKSLKFTTGLISRPHPYDVVVESRSPEHTKLIHSNAEQYPVPESSMPLLEKALGEAKI